MKKSAKLTALVLAFVLLLTAVGGTLAYLTAESSQKNVFSVGKVNISLTETVEVNNGKTGADKVTYDNRVSTSNGVTTFSGLMPGNTIIKAPVIKNTGTNDAYVRVLVNVSNTKGNFLVDMCDAIEGVYRNGLGYSDDKVQEIYEKIFDGWGIQFIKDENNIGYARTWMKRDTGSTLLAVDYTRKYCGTYGQYWQYAENNVFQSDYEKLQVQNNEDGFGYYWDNTNSGYYADSVEDMSLTYVFYLKLTPNESFKLFDGLNIPEDFDQNRTSKDEDGKNTVVINQMAMFEGLQINVYADAIQTEGFATWTDAIDALNTQHPLGWWKE